MSEPAIPAPTEADLSLDLAAERAALVAAMTGQGGPKQSLRSIGCDAYVIALAATSRAVAAEQEAAKLRGAVMQYAARVAGLEAEVQKYHALYMLAGSVVRDMEAEKG